MTKKKILIVGLIFSLFFVNFTPVFAQGGDPTFPIPPAGVGDPAFTAPSNQTGPQEPSAWDWVTNPVGTAASEIAQGLVAGIGKIIGFIFYFASYLIGLLAGILFTLGGVLIKTGISWNQALMDSPTIGAGWVVTRDLANLGFVLAIIIIAFATILRQQNYAIKQTLWKLIVVALLVNFSLVIAGVFIDFAGLITDIFISKATQGNISEFANALASTFGVQKLMQTNANNLSNFEGITEFGANLISTIASLSFVSLFTVLAAIALLGVAVMIFIRYIVLTVLLILMPLAWLFWIFPGLSGNASKWWDNFLRWTFFLPASSFFLYLTILLVHNQGDNAASPLKIAKDAINAGGAADTGETLLSIMVSPFETFARMIAVLGLLVGGLMAANSFGITTANTFVGMATGVKNWAIGAVGKAGTGAARTLGERPVKATARGLSNILNTRGLRWIPGAKGAVAGLSAFGARKEDVEEYQKTYLEKLTPAQFKNIQRTTPLGPVAKAALLAESIKRKKLSDLTDYLADPAQREKRLKEFMEATETTNPGIERENIQIIKEMLDINPHLAPALVGKEPVDIVDKMRADKIADVHPDALKDAKTVSAIAKSKPKLSSLARIGSTVHVNNLKNALGNKVGIDDKGNFIAGSFADRMNTLEGNLEKTQKDLQDAKDRNDATAMASAQTLRNSLNGLINEAKKGADKEQNDAWESLKFLEQTIANYKTVI